MTNPISIAVVVPSDAASAFREAASRAGLTVDAFASDCILSQLEMASRYRTLLSRVEAVDAALTELAEMVGKMSADGDGQLDLSQICKAACPGTRKE